MTATESNWRTRQLWFAPTAAILIVALAALAEVGFPVPKLFGTGEAVLQGSVIISISIIGGLILSAYLQSLFLEWRNFGETLELEKQARRELKRLQRKLKNVDRLIENNRDYETEIIAVGAEAEEQPSLSIDILKRE